MSEGLNDYDKTGVEVPEMEEFARYEEEGWTVVAHIVQHAVTSAWNYTIIRSNGVVVAYNIHGEPLMHDHANGVHPDDEATAAQEAHEALDQAIWDPMSMS